MTDQSAKDPLVVGESVVASPGRSRQGVEIRWDELSERMGLV